MEKELKNKRNEKGITLVALVVTIVVLLILAGVSIITLFDENGIINSAKKAKEETEKGIQNDINGLNELTKELNKYENDGIEDANLNKEDYALLTFNAFVGKYTRQKADYLRIRVEIADNSNAEDKIIFNIGTDWKENIKKENDSENHLFLKSTSELKMIQVLENDYTNKSDNTQIDDLLVGNTFTNVEVSCQVKRNKQYKITVIGQGATVKDNIISPKQITICETTTNNITGDETTKITKANSQPTQMFDLTGDTYMNTTDSGTLAQISLGRISSNNGVTPSCYKTYNDSGNIAKNVMSLFDENGNIINSDFIGADFNRDGYINIIDQQAILRAAGGRY